MRSTVSSTPPLSKRRCWEAVDPGGAGQGSTTCGTEDSGDAPFCDRTARRQVGTLGDMAALKNLVNRLTKPMEEHDREKLVEFCSQLGGCSSIEELSPRRTARVAGEISSVRIVPRAGAPSLEVGVSDGRGVLTAVFFGRRKIAGLSPGRRLVVEGMVAPLNNRAYMYNPVYELLP